MEMSELDSIKTEMKLIMETVDGIRNARLSSIDKGDNTKGSKGKIKIYFDPSKLEEAEQIIRNSYELFDLADVLHGEKL